MIPERCFIMAAEIYYFSGTGNSLVVARDIASPIGICFFHRNNNAVYYYPSNINFSKNRSFTGFI
ncbi:MAG TPA: hypothetical protein DCK76_03555 [Desulfotomaculum sp.]|nr:hypothetical protein [Desulfotomaculum sp.]HBY04774.1 hypothetical protein [Desulfotomaculum sp.]